MKRLFTLIAAVALLATSAGVMAQCSINPNDTTEGFSPLALPCIEQGVVYGQAVQVHLPSSIYVAAVGFSVPIDSITVLSITGLPAGITYSTNPTWGSVRGGSTGCIWFSGTTNAPVGNYNLTFHVAVVSIETIDTTLNAFGLAYTLSVCAPDYVGETCDSSTDYPPGATPTIYALRTPQVGYLSGDNNEGLTGVAEPVDPVVPGSLVGGAFFSFGVLTINPGDSDKMVIVQVLAGDTNNNEAPGAVIGMDSFPLRAIAPTIETQTANLLFIPFSSVDTITDTIFYIALRYPTDSGDTVALWSSTLSSSGLAYFYSTVNAGWYPLSDLTGQPTENTDILMGAQICTSYVEGPVADFGAYSLAGLLSSVNTCTTDTVLYLDESAGAITNWSWSFQGGSPPTSTIQDPTVIYTAPGTYNVTLKVTDTAGLQNTSTLTHYVDFYQSPSVTISTTDANSATSDNGSAIATVTGGTPPYVAAWSNSATGDTASGLTANTTYTITVLDSNGCSTTGSATILSAGINSVTGSQQIKIYPNPTSSSLNVEWSAQANAQVDILDMTGKVMRTYEVNGTLKNTFDISSLAAGSYIVKITDRQSKQFQSVTISKQ